MRLSNFFKTASSWSKDHDAINMDGNPVPLSAMPRDYFNNGVRLRALSLQGAVAYFFSYEREPESRIRIMDKLRKAISIHTGRNMYIAQFNSSIDTTFDDLKKVIAIAEKIK